MPFCAYCGNQLAEVSYAPCPKCGNPSNGAPQGAKAPPAPGSSGSKTAMIVVFVLVGGFFLIAILGILAAIAIPNFMTATERSKQKRTMADMRMVATAVEAYATDANQYPKASSVDELRSMLAPTYIREVPSLDGWMHPLRYEAWSSGEQSGEPSLDRYALGSGGKDGVFEKESLQEYSDGEVTGFDRDLVFANSSFVQYPAGSGRSTN